MEKLWNIIYRLKIIKRWGTSFSIESESVAEHNYYVTMLAYILADIDKNLNNVKDIDMEKLLVKALYHDAFESYTAHIVSPIKHHNDFISYSTMQLKGDFNKRLLGLIPKECYDIISNLEDNENQNINKYIEIADTIEGYCYCAFQVHIGNKDFINKLNIMKHNVDRLTKEYNYVKYFFDKLFSESDFEIVY